MLSKEIEGVQCCREYSAEGKISRDLNGKSGYAYFDSQVSLMAALNSSRVLV